MHLRTRVESFDYKIRQLHGNRLDRVRGRSGRIFQDERVRLRKVRWTDGTFGVSSRICVLLRLDMMDVQREGEKRASFVCVFVCFKSVVGYAYFAEKSESSDCVLRRHVFEQTDAFDIFAEDVQRRRVCDFLSLGGVGVYGRHE